MSAEDIEYMDDYKEFPTKESALDWLDNFLSLDERNNLIRALQQEPNYSEIPTSSTIKNDIRDNRVENELNRVEDELEPTTKNDLVVDCISRDSAIKALDYDIKSFDFKSGVSEHMDDIAKLLNTIYEIQVNNIKAMPPVTPQPRWIPISERLPEDYETVIASNGHEYVYPEARYSKEYGWQWAYESGMDYWEDLKGVDAWMPLPQPYREVEK